VIKHFFNRELNSSHPPANNRLQCGRLISQFTVNAGEYGSGRILRDTLIQVAFPE